MALEMNCIGDDNLRLIDISEEDDYFIEFPFCDPFQDFRLSVTFDNVSSSQTQESVSHESESVEPRRPSFLRKSIAWDSAFFTSAGVLNPEELFMVNKGLRKAEVKQRSSGTRKETRPHQVSDSYHNKSSDSNGFHLETLEGNLFKDVKPYLHKLSKKSKVATSNSLPGCGQANTSSGRKMNICPQNKVKSTETPTNKSLNLQGPKLISSRQTNNIAAEESAKMEHKTRKAGMDLTMSKRSRHGDLSGLSKSIALNSPVTERKIRVHGSYESCSSASSSKNLSKSIIRKINPRNTKPTNSPSSVGLPLPSTCSSSTSPASSFDGWFSETLSSTTTTTNQDTMPASGFQSQNSEKRTPISQNATPSSIGITLFSDEPKKIKSSGLRMPSPKIGFFDEEPTLKVGMQDHLRDRRPSSENCLKVRKFLSSENVGRKVGGSYSKFKEDMQIPKEISRNTMKMKQKRQKDDTGSVHMSDTKKTHDSDQWENQKENVFSFEDQVKGISRHLEVIELDRDLTEIKVQQSCVKPSQTSLPPTDEYTTLC